MWIPCFANSKLSNRKALQSQRQIHKAPMVLKCFNGLVPEYLTSKFASRIGSNYVLGDSVHKLSPFQELTTWKIVLVTTAQPFGPAYNIRESDSLKSI